MKLTSVFIPVLLLCSLKVIAQTQTYDIATLTPPAGWTKKSENQALLFENFNQSQNKYALIRIFNSLQSTGDANADFQHFWNDLVITPYKTGQGLQPERQNVDGWNILTGKANVVDQGYPYKVILKVYSLGDKTLPMMFFYDNDSYVSDFNQFLNSFKLKKSSNSNQTISTNTNTNQNTGNNTNVSSSTVKTPQYVTTNFDDGWVSSLTSNYVRVVKNGVEVRLYYPDENADKNRGGTGRRFEYHYWDVWVRADFQAGEVYERPFEIGRDAILEAPVKNLQTGQQGYAALMLYFESGVCTPIMGFAPTKELLNEYLPNHDAFEKMLRYNEFAVAAADLVGKWGTSGGASTNYYNAATGQFIGTSTAATGDTFVFNSNGTYTSRHSYYTTGGGGGRQNFSGNFTADVWTIRLTNRLSNDPGEYWCKFEAVKGGTILHLMNKKFTGEKYRLFRQ